MSRPTLKDTVRLINRAQKLLVEKGWAKFVMGRTASGTPVSATNPKACKFCAQGALMRANHDLRLSNDHLLKAIKELHDTISYIPFEKGGGTSLLTYSDGSPNKDRVVKLFADTAKSLKKRIHK